MFVCVWQGRDSNDELRSKAMTLLGRFIAVKVRLLCSREGHFQVRLVLLEVACFEWFGWPTAPGGVGAAVARPVRSFSMSSSSSSSLWC